MKAEFLKSCIVSGESVHAGETRELNPHVFNYLKSLRRVREAAPEPQKVEAPEQPPTEIPQKKKGNK
jgi:hypothetical protein